MNSETNQFKKDRADESYLFDDENEVLPFKESSESQHIGGVSQQRISELSSMLPHSNINFKKPSNNSDNPTPIA